MRFLRAVAVAVVLSAAVIAGAALLGGDEVAGAARPMDKRSLLAMCEYDQFDVDVDVDTVTYGPMILNHQTGAARGHADRHGDQLLDEGHHGRERTPRSP